MTATKHKTSLSFLALGVFLFIILLASAQAVTLGQSNLTNAIKLGSSSSITGTIYINNTYNNITIYNITGGNISGTCKLGEICYGDSNLNNSITSTSNITTDYSTVSNGTRLKVGNINSGVNELETDIHKDRIRLGSAWSFIDIKNTLVPFGTMNISVIPYFTTSSFWNWNIKQYSTQNYVSSANFTMDYLTANNICYTNGSNCNLTLPTTYGYNQTIPAINYANNQGWNSTYNASYITSVVYTNLAWQNQSNNFTAYQYFNNGMNTNSSLNITNTWLNETLFQVRVSTGSNQTFSNTSVIIRHQGRPTTMAGIYVESDYQFTGGESMHIASSDYGGGGRMYFESRNSAGNVVPLYSMEFTNVQNWVNSPAFISQQTKTGASSISACQDRTCSYIGQQAGDILLSTSAGAYITTNHGTSLGINPFTFMNWINQTSPYNYFNSVYTFGVNGSQSNFNSTNLHSQWTLNETKEPIMKLDTRGNLNLTGTYTSQNASAWSGYAMCYTTGGKLGHCTSVVGVGGTCTCASN